MSFHAASRVHFDFTRLKETEKKEDHFDENVNALIEENGLFRKKLPKNSDSLMRAVSEALYFTSNRNEEIQQSLLTHLTQLIASDKLTRRLSSFQGNSLMLKDFSNNPHLAGFEKINLELVSLLFKVKVILYTMNEDHYLSATIYNHNCPKTIELLRTKTTQYDAIFSKDYIQKAAVCQNIVLNLIDRAMNGRSDQYKNINGGKYTNITYESSLASPLATREGHHLDHFRITRGVHKKSLSDNFNTNFELMEEQQMKFYDAFMNAAPPDDFLKTLNLRKDTAESGFSINANFDFIDDHAFDPPFQAKEFAIKNYPILSNFSPGHGNGAGFDLPSPIPTFSKAKFKDHANVLFNENLSLAEIERLEKTVNSATTQDSKQINASPFYRNASPPGLSPLKFNQRTNFTEAIQTPTTDFLSPSPTIQNSNSFAFGGNSPSKRPVSPFSQSYHPGGGNSEQQLFNSQVQAFAPQGQPLNSQAQSFTLQPQQLNSLYQKRTGSIGASLTASGQAEEFTPVGYDQGLSFDQSAGYEQDYDQGLMFGPNFNGAPREKKKPIILDESKERYAGRLKFFDENKKYGFIIMDDDGSDIFVHYDDLVKANITKDYLRTIRMGNIIRLSFGCMAYIGKYNKSRKAIDIQLTN
jgi:hypothetical protein